MKSLIVRYTDHRATKYATVELMARRIHAPLFIFHGVNKALAVFWYGRNIIKRNWE